MNNYKISITTLFATLISKVAVAQSINSGEITQSINDITQNAYNIIAALCGLYALYGIGSVIWKYNNNEEERAKSAFVHVLIAFVLFMLIKPMLRMFGLSI